MEHKRIWKRMNTMKDEENIIDQKESYVILKHFIHLMALLITFVYVLCAASSCWSMVGTFSSAQV